MIRLLWITKDFKFLLFKLVFVCLQDHLKICGVDHFQKLSNKLFLDLNYMQAITE
jgi:hypothetical protein